METNVLFRVVKSEKVKPGENQKLVSATVQVWREAIPVLSYKLGYPHIAKTIRNGIDDMQSLEPDYEKEIMGIMLKPEDADEISPVVRELSK